MARAPVLRDAIGVGLATGTYGLSFGALSISAGLSVLQTCALSALMFTGASQFAFVGVIASGGNPLAGAAGAVLLSLRNALYGIQLSSLLGVRRARKVMASHLVIDESAAMGLARSSPDEGRLGFWATGLAVFVCWNTATLIGALGAQGLSDPEVLGLDVVAPAAFAALLAPRMRASQGTGRRTAWIVAAVAGVVVLASVRFVPNGVPLLLGAAVAAPVGLVLARRQSRGGPAVLPEAAP